MTDITCNTFSLSRAMLLKRRVHRIGKQFTSNSSSFPTGVGCRGRSHHEGTREGIHKSTSELNGQHLLSKGHTLNISSTQHMDHMQYSGSEVKKPAC